MTFIWVLGGLMGIPGLMANRAQSADGRIQRESTAAEDSEDETPPVRQPNTIGDPGIESPTAMTNLRRVWNQILGAFLSPYRLFKSLSTWPAGIFNPGGGVQYIR